MSCGLVRQARNSEPTHLGETSGNSSQPVAALPCFDYFEAMRLLRPPIVLERGGRRQGCAARTVHLARVAEFRRIDYSLVNGRRATPPSRRNEIMKRISDYGFWTNRAVFGFSPIGIPSLCCFPSGICTVILTQPHCISPFSGEMPGFPSPDVALRPVRSRWALRYLY
jgi:hypothetical protein